MRRPLYLIALSSALAAGLTACADDHAIAGPAPHAPTATLPVTDKVAADHPALAPLTDALDRLGPQLGTSADAVEARALLVSILEQARAGKTKLAGSPPVQNLAAVLDRVQAADPGLAPELDAVRLALAPLR
jgi:hypothetical protein